MFFTTLRMFQALSGAPCPRLKRTCRGFCPLPPAKHPCTRYKYPLRCEGYSFRGLYRLFPIKVRATDSTSVFYVKYVQERTGRYIARLGKELVGMLFSTDSTSEIVDLSLLKCRERDQLEAVFKSWSCDVPCNSEYFITSTQILLLFC